jgi:large subunit ribosomal protein L18
MADKNKLKVNSRMKRKARLRNKIKGTPEKPRLSVYRSSNQIYAQLIDDTNGKSLICVSSLSKTVQEALSKSEEKGKIISSKLVGKELAKRAQDLKIKQVVFDRNGFVYHGRVKAIADGAREGGLKF